MWQMGAGEMQGVGRALGAESQLSALRQSTPSCKAPEPGVSQCELPTSKLATQAARSSETKDIKY